MPFGITLSPTLKCFTLDPIAITSPTPSFPGIAGKGGLLGYLPCIVFMSAGLTGANNHFTETFIKY